MPLDILLHTPGGLALVEIRFLPALRKCQAA
ncbi:MAG: hypothetical protein AB1671_13660 [Thermodesulfobacteriota bacterium]